MTNVIDFNEGDQIKGIYLLNNVTKGKTSNGSDYLSVKVQDATKDIDGKIWQATESQLETIVSGKFVQIQANVIKYRDTLQLKIEKCELVDESQVDVNRFVKSAREEVADLRNELQQYLYEIDDRIVNLVVSNLLKIYDEKLQSYPAASKIHHAYHGGLLFHVVSMLRIAKSLINLYPSLNKNYLYAGIIIHDLGKAEELSGVVATEYTTKGKLLGHISMIHSQVHNIAKEIGEEDSEQVMILEHLVLSHHGKLEFGSPVLPMTREAEILTFIDNIDARMDTFDRIYEGVEPGEFTQREYSLENRAFYKYKK